MLWLRQLGQNLWTTHAGSRVRTGFSAVSAHAEVLRGVEKSASPAPKICFAFADSSVCGTSAAGSRRGQPPSRNVITRHITRRAGSASAHGHSGRDLQLVGRKHLVQPALYGVSRLARWYGWRRQPVLHAEPRRGTVGNAAPLGHLPQSCGSFPSAWRAC